jgi:cell division septation protein DedD
MAHSWTTRLIGVAVVLAVLVFVVPRMLPKKQMDRRPVKQLPVPAMPVVKTDRSAAKLTTEVTAKEKTPMAFWAVQVGSFKQASHASALQLSLTKKHYKSFSKKKKGWVRVYVGPELTREDALSELKRLVRQTRLNGFVIKLDVATS